mmetsp:Transcript_97810/g.232901  ORF Transcript_97810/g.232901 Transcript_97810/m.232901 type:complete len:227 (+) Transcript_97810:182-862(+)
MPDPRRADGLGGRREGDALPVREDHRLVLVWHAGVHHRTIAVALDVARQPPVRLTPRCFALNARVFSGKAAPLDLFQQLFCCFMANQPHQCIPQAASPGEVHRKVNEVVPATETRPVQQLEDIVASELLRHIAKHHSHPFSIVTNVAVVIVTYVTCQLLQGGRIAHSFGGLRCTGAAGVSKKARRHVANGQFSWSMASCSSRNVIGFRSRICLRRQNPGRSQDSVA